MRSFLLAALLLLGAGAASADEQQQAIKPHHVFGTLHGFPSMSDTTGQVIADGELTQERAGDRLRVRIRWDFADGREVEERDEFQVAPTLTQRQFSFVETRKEIELRRFEIDFSTGKARAVTRNEKGEVERKESEMQLPAGRSFAGYGTALAVSELSLEPGGEGRITFVAFTPKPRDVTVKVTRDRTERVSVAGRAILTDRYTIHAEIPFPASLFVSARDAHLWFTHTPPPALVRAEQNLAAKDDPVVVIDVTPRGAARAPGKLARQEGSEGAR
jgi:hypothetical protein